MNNFVVSEEAIHYAAAFIERYADKSPTKEREKAERELRALSNYLLENLYTPMYILIVRHKKKD